MKKLVNESLLNEYSPYSKNHLPSELAISRLEKMRNSAVAAKEELDEMSINPTDMDEEIVDKFMIADRAIDELMDIIDEKIRQLLD